MEGSVHISPPHSLIIISEPGRGEIPPSLGGSIIAATASCIAVGCRSEIDGDTELTLGPLNEVGTSTHLAFSGALSTPRKSIAIQTVFNEAILEMAVSSEETRLSIWVNDLSEPDKIVVGVEV